MTATAISVESRERREMVDPFWAKQLGMPDFSPRLALQLLGTDVFRNHFHQDIWVLSVMARYNETENVVISDARFPNEVQIIRDLGGHIIQVDRGEEPDWWMTAKIAAGGNTNAIEVMDKHHGIHSSEWAWANERADELIHNDGTLEQLYSMIGLLNNKYQF